jgi:hypothetical protein
MATAFYRSPNQNKFAGESIFPARWQKEHSGSVENLQISGSIKGDVALFWLSDIRMQKELRPLKSIPVPLNQSRRNAGASSFRAR